MWCRVSSGQLPRTNDCARLRSSTASSATRRWPRTTRSSAHSLLPMPLSPMTSTPRPRMSIRTPWMMPRAARYVSRTADSRDIASGVAARVRSSGTCARSASIGSSGGGAKPSVMRRHGRSWLRTRRSTAVRAAAVERLEIANLALAEHEDAAAAQVGVESRQGEAGLLRVRNRDVAAEAVGARQQLEIERAGVGEVAQHGGDGHAGRWAGCGQRSLSCCRPRRLSRQSGSINP